MANLVVPISSNLESQVNFPGNPSGVNEPHHNTSDPNNSIVKSTCLLPQYQMYTWVLAMVCLGTFLKLSYIIKSTFLLIMVIVYTILMTVVYPEAFNEIQV